MSFEFYYQIIWRRDFAKTSESLKRTQNKSGSEIKSMSTDVTWSYCIVLWKNTFIKNVGCQMKQPSCQMMHTQDRGPLASSVLWAQGLERHDNCVSFSITINLNHNQVYVPLHCFCFLPPREKRNNFDTSCANTVISNKVLLDITRLITNKTMEPSFAFLWIPIGLH